MKSILNKRIIVSVTNDLSTDNRVHKVCNTLTEMGFDVLLVGRKIPGSLPLKQRTYKTLRFRMLFIKGPLFYACYNFRLFLFLAFSRFDVLLSNDLDTLPANYFASLVKRKPLVYDSHEYFTEVPELVHRPFMKKVWELLERFMVPKVHAAYTVCNSIASVYTGKYGIDFRVVRNLPYAREVLMKNDPADEIPFIIYQGALNVGRGLKQAVLAMHYLEGARLVVAGSGDLDNELKQLVQYERLEEKISFTGRIPIELLSDITSNAAVGLSIEEDIGLNYRFALPNKLFDYIQARVPVLVTNRPEMAAVVQHYEIGEVIDDLDPPKLAAILKEMIFMNDRQSVWRQNLEQAARELVWEKEVTVLHEIFKPYL